MGPNLFRLGGNRKEVLIPIFIFSHILHITYVIKAKKKSTSRPLYDIFSLPDKEVRGIQNSRQKHIEQMTCGGS